MDQSKKPLPLNVGGLPRSFWLHLDKTLKSMKYGKLVLTVHDSRIQAMDVTEKHQLLLDNDHIVEKE